ncbi:ABC transporter permease [soil metagenome]
MTAVATPPAHVGKVNIRISKSTVAGIAGFVGMLAIWQIVGMTIFSKSGAVPPPTAILSQMKTDGWAFYGPNIRTTAREAAWGWIYGNGVAIGLALLFISLPLVEKTLMRVAITAYCLPIIAIGPILQIVFDGDTPKIILSAMTCFFTTLIGALVGLRSASASSIDLVTAYGGGQWSIMRKVRMKSSLPALFAGLRIAGPAAVLGAIIGEYLGGDSGLGVAMIASQQTLNIDRTWGIALVSTAMAGIAYGVTALVGRWLTPWARTPAR